MGQALVALPLEIVGAHLHDGGSLGQALVSLPLQIDRANFHDGGSVGQALATLPLEIGGAHLHDGEVWVRHSHLRLARPIFMTMVADSQSLHKSKEVSSSCSHLQASSRLELQLVEISSMKRKRAEERKVS